MSVLFVLLPMSLFMACGALGAFIWATKKGQFDDLDGAAQRLVADDCLDGTATENHFRDR